jgi:hypothetical protein
LQKTIASDCDIIEKEKVECMIDTPTYTPPVPSSVTPSTSPRGIAAHVPQQLAQISQQALLTATVVKNDRSGNTILKVPGGEVTVHTTQPLKAGSTLVLKVLINVPVQNSGLSAAQVLQHFQAQIVSIDGKPLQQQQHTTKAQENPQGRQDSGEKRNSEGNAQQQGRQENPNTGQRRTLPLVTAVPTLKVGGGGSAASSTPASYVSSPGAAVITLAGGAVVRAVAIAPSEQAGSFLPKADGAEAPAKTSSDGSAPATQGKATATGSNTPAAATQQGGQAANTPAIKAADGLVLHILAIESPKTGTTPSTTTNTQTTPATPTTAPAAGTQTPNAATTNTQTPTGSGGNAPAATPAGDASALRPTVPPQTANASFVATVIGTEKSGEMVLKSELGTLKILSNQPLATGTQLRMEVVQLQAQQPLSAASTQLNTALPIMESSSVGELVAFLQGHGSNEAKQALEQIMPKADGQMAAKILWFMGGVKQGDVAQWMGQNLIRFLQAEGKSELVGRLQKEFGRYAKITTEGGSQQQWSMFQFPVMDGDRLQHGFMFSRQYSSEEEEGGKDTRFVIEVEMTQLGNIQLDGFFKRPHTKNNAFNLVVRSHAPLPSEMKVEMQDMFGSMLEVAGLEGSMQFQVSKQFAVNPREEMLSENSNTSEGGEITA